jgi:hypothetical protein
MRYPLSLILLLAMLAPPALHAGRIRFDRFACSIAIPDSGWRWDSSLAIGHKADTCMIVLRASNEEGSKRLTLVIINDTGRPSINDFVPSYALIGMLLRHHRAHPLDTSLLTVGGVMGVMVIAGGSSRDLPLAMGMVAANDRGYAIVTGLDEGRPEEDPELEEIVGSFSFIGRPTHVFQGAICSYGPPPLIVTLGPMILGGAVAIGTVILLIRWRVRRGREKAEREWEKL